jgi:putative GTP pyrophosphokinase
MEKDTLPDRRLLQNQYEQRLESLVMITAELRSSFEQALSGLLSPPTIKTRLKDFNSYFEKYIRILNNAPTKDEEPRITDLIGVRIVCPFLEDIETVGSILKTFFKVVEEDKKGSKQSFREFGYQSTHILVEIPRQLTEKHGYCGCDVAEVQIRTILQDAWAEVEHELVYKADFAPYDMPMKRKLAAINASLSLADIVFQEIRTYQRRLLDEVEKRRQSFFKKVDDAMDPLLPSADGAGQGGAEDADEPPEEKTSADASMDDLLLNAVTAHNEHKFDEAIYFYSRILEMGPDPSVQALVYNHRGIAYFATSRYKEAIDDFSQSLALDSSSYKSAYYRGIVRSVLRQFSEAVDDYSLSIAINPYQHFCLYRRSYAYYHLGDLPQALADCEASLALKPDSQSARQLRALLHSKLKM